MRRNVKLVSVEGALIAKFRNNGQSCIATNRFYVHEKVYQEFVEKFSSQINVMKISNPVTDEESDLGPIIDKKFKYHLEAVTQSALIRGAK